MRATVLRRGGLPTNFGQDFSGGLDLFPFFQAFPVDEESTKDRQKMDTFQKTENMKTKDTPAKNLQTKESDYYHVEFNLNISAVVEFIIPAKNDEQARRRADRILQQCEPMVKVQSHGGVAIDVVVPPANVETELLEISSVSLSAGPAVDKELRFVAEALKPPHHKPESSAENEPFRIQERGRAITLPFRWNRERDYGEFVARFDEADHPVSFLRERLCEEYERFNAVLDNALEHYLSKIDPDVACRPNVLSAEEKIECLLDLVATHSVTASYRRRLEEDLAECLRIDQERGRILKASLRATEEPWLYPLCKLADGIATSAMELEESLVCEQCGYSGPLVFG
jgi:hypothetical protein